ncbi:MAG: DeoR family transcriptional regulator [Kiritimatiellia bacterium]
MICTMSPPTRTTNAKVAVATELRQRELANVESLADCLELSPATVRQALQELEKKGAVEVLRPCRPQPVNDDVMDYYRWRRPTDMDYLWEQEYLRRETWPSICARYCPSLLARTF